jgi:hypothetical protein
MGAARVRDYRSSVSSLRPCRFTHKTICRKAQHASSAERHFADTHGKSAVNCGLARIAQRIPGTRAAHPRGARAELTPPSAIENESIGRDDGRFLKLKSEATQLQ